MWAVSFMTTAPAHAASTGEDTQQKSLVDHQAHVFNLQGDVRILKSGSNQWLPLTRQFTLEPGDEIRTGNDAFVEIYYDAFFLNIARIGSDTLAEFRAIEPTDLFLSDGRIFSALDGLPRGSTYEVATPTSVAGVRGTSFLREFDIDSFRDTTLVMEGLVQVIPVLDEAGTVDINRIIDVKPDQSLVFEGRPGFEKNNRELEPRPMTSGEKNELRGMGHSAKENLQHFAGGEPALQAAREEFERMSRDDTFRIYKQMRVEDFERHREVPDGAMRNILPGPEPVMQVGTAPMSRMSAGPMMEAAARTAPARMLDEPDRDMNSYEPESHDFEQEMEAPVTRLEQPEMPEFEQELQMEFEKTFEDSVRDGFEPVFEEPRFEEPEFEEPAYIPPVQEGFEPQEDIDPCQYDPQLCESNTNLNFCTQNPDAPECD